MAERGACALRLGFVALDETAARRAVATVIAIARRPGGTIPAIAAAEPDERTGLRRLYVVLTRAVSHLIVLHSQDLPDPLG